MCSKESTSNYPGDEYWDATHLEEQAIRDQEAENERAIEKKYSHFSDDDPNSFTEDTQQISVSECRNFTTLDLVGIEHKIKQMRQRMNFAMQEAKIYCDKIYVQDWK